MLVDIAPARNLQRLKSPSSQLFIFSTPKQAKQLESSIFCRFTTIRLLRNWDLSQKSVPGVVWWQIKLGRTLPYSATKC